MELSLFLGQLLGIYFIVAGVIVILRRKSLIPAVAEFGDNRALILVVALVEFIAGLAIAIAHPIFTLDWKGLITLVGWWMMVEGVLYLMLPHSRMRKFIRMVNKLRWYTLGGALSILIGVYLAGGGFGFW
ncbi:hypothetical protein COU18_00500 [Candidatus Kaiserbacteria bacterium CG10_big_fil_rev_8_21_14_0_10_51_14]|uniref:DUF2065 domain-containing protein n=1 Tax=Candidatus Kaiserbacteria bacterium CG10_big_fil_rev_8_21_14_0_10_51_14 TaxID=1974610 RepID=A0A2H0UCU1_9BACT|nr:MAG: hypothetical protein COU18_00500 [Candidatus Kaiserbacteria bacterium CG10_big_fil_rev_8_21_14_0_10_51_14]